VLRPDLPDPDEVYDLPMPPIDDRKEIENWHRARYWALGKRAYAKNDFRAAMPEKLSWAPKLKGVGGLDGAVSRA
jgi:hypothetical protein